jgi:hypothetical protein
VPGEALTDEFDSEEEVFDGEDMHPAASMAAMTIKMAKIPILRFMGIQYLLQCRR